MEVADRAVTATHRARRSPWRWVARRVGSRGTGVPQAMAATEFRKKGRRLLESPLLLSSEY
jgi:hypothetical protein